MGKYEYQTLFDEAIKHGVSKEDYARESSKMCILTWIANELAESNRLKRLEMSLKLFPHVAPSDNDYEDKA